MNIRAVSKNTMGTRTAIVTKCFFYLFHSSFPDTIWTDTMIRLFVFSLFFFFQIQLSNFEYNMWRKRHVDKGSVDRSGSCSICILFSLFLIFCARLLLTFTAAAPRMDRWILAVSQVQLFTLFLCWHSIWIKSRSKVVRKQISVSREQNWSRFGRSWNQHIWTLDQDLTQSKPDKKLQKPEFFKIG